MASIENTRPKLTGFEASELVQKAYGIEVTSIRSLPSYQDQNFWLRAASGREYILKIANAIEPKECLELQNDAMRYLGQGGKDKRIPEICHTQRGEELFELSGDDGKPHYVRLLTYLPGKPLAMVNPHSTKLLRNIGRFLGEMDARLAHFPSPIPQHSIPWDLDRAGELILEYGAYVTDDVRRELLQSYLTQIEGRLFPQLLQLRKSLIHHDANDYNVLVAVDGKQVSGIIDFNDILFTYTANELAIALAYVMLDKADPLTAGMPLVAGYNETHPLTDIELENLYYLVVARLCTSVSMSAFCAREAPDNQHITVTEASAWTLLRKLAEIGPSLAHYAFRQACGLTPCPQSERIVRWLKDNASRIGPVLEHDLNKATVFDLSVGSEQLPRLDILDDPQALGAILFRQMAEKGTDVGIGRYDEARLIYRDDAFRVEGNEGAEWRTIHLGIDLFAEAGTSILAPLDGMVHSLNNNNAPQDYGPTIILEHVFDDVRFFTLYGHLSLDSLDSLQPGRLVRQGDALAKIGDAQVNGGWPPHLHFQIICDMMGETGEFPGVARPSQRPIWLSISPDPNLILQIPLALFPSRAMGSSAIRAARDSHLGRSLSLSYRRPLKIVRGWRQYLFDDTGRAFLDAVNNVCHVGHCHPRVVAALQRQAAVLNTNTRYLHENITRYAERICQTLPEPLSVCFFVCSGSEANELALRLARTHTGQRDTIVIEGAYHGNSGELIEISPYKYNGPGGSGRLEHIQEVPMPDPFRGLYQGNHAGLGHEYAQHIEAAMKRIHDRGQGVAAFISESLMGCGGQIVLPAGYLKEAFQIVRDAGGVCISDEVQVGFGRVGTHFWGFQTQEVVPDIVTMGKPMGNGHPLAAVVTTQEIAESFANGMEYFNTFGGNPVSCAVGLAVLDVIRDEKLQQNALVIGRHLQDRLTRLMGKHKVIGDVRGLGLFLGVELVLDRGAKTPAATAASYVAERMRDNGILISTDGPDHNVLKIKPPIIFTEEDADFLADTLDKVLEEDPVKRM